MAAYKKLGTPDEINDVINLGFKMKEEIDTNLKEIKNLRSEVKKYRSWLKMSDGNGKAPCSTELVDDVKKLKKLDKQIDRLGAYLLQYRGDEIQKGGAVDNAIRMLDECDKKCIKKHDKFHKEVIHMHCNV